MALSFARVFGADNIHTPVAKTPPPGSADFDVLVHTVWTKANGAYIRTDFATVGVAFSPLYRLELNAEFSSGRTMGRGKMVRNQGNLTVGAKYRLWQHSYEGGAWYVTAGYRAELPSNRHWELWDLGLSPVQSAYASLGHGLNHRGQILMSASRKNLYWGGYGEYNFRTEDNYVRLGNEARLGGVVYYTLGDYTKTRRPSLLVDAWWVNMQRAHFFGLRQRETGGNTLTVAPGIAFTLTSRLSVKASVMTPVRQSMGKQVPMFKSGIMLGIGYRL